MEERWLTWADPVMMLGLLGRLKDNRKLALFCVACCRTAGADTHKSQGRILDAVERYVDGGGEVDDIASAARTYAFPSSVARGKNTAASASAPRTSGMTSLK